MNKTLYSGRRIAFLAASLFLILSLLAACGPGNANNQGTPGGDMTEAVPGTGADTTPAGGEETTTGTDTTPAAGQETMTAETPTGATDQETPTTAAGDTGTTPTAEATQEGGGQAGAATGGDIGDPPSEGTIQMAVVRGAMRETMEKLASAYEQQYPGVTVEIVEEPEGGAFEALIAAGNQPDVIVGSFGSMIGKYAEQNFLAPLEDLDGAQDLFARLDPNTVQEVYGHNYYIPMGADVTLMIYNKELFEEAGLDPESPPATFEEFLSAAEQIQALPDRDGKKVYGTVFWNEALAWGGWYWNMLQPIYLNANQNQCQLLNRLGTDIVFDQPECNIQAFFEFTAAAQKFAPATMEQSFFSRTIGMWPQYGYSWEPNLETAEGQPMVIGEDVGIAPVPVLNEGDQSYTTYGGRPLMILRTTPDREARAWHFVRFLMQDENNLQILQELGYLPVLESLKSDEFFQDPTRKPFVDALQNAVFPEIVKSADDVANEIQGVYQQAVVQGGMPPEQAVEAAAQQARSVIQQ